MHGSHADICIADHPVKIYVVSVAGEAAPYPPPSDPLLATPGFDRILLPRSGPTGLALILLPSVRAITFDLASALSSGSNFGWSLFFCPGVCAWQTFQLRVCDRTPAHSILAPTAVFVVLPPPPRSKAPGPDPWPRPSPRARPLCFWPPGHSRADSTRQQLPLAHSRRAKPLKSCIFDSARSLHRSG